MKEAIERVLISEEVTRNEKAGENVYTGVTYWVDVTEADEIRTRYLETRPAPAIIVLDNLDELGRSQPERVRNELRDAAEDKLRQWSESYNGILRRYDRDRFLAVFEKKDLERMKQSRFPIVEQMHQIESPNGIEATISIGFGEDGENLGEGLQFADKATELALSRGGDQVAVKNQLSFEFFGGRGLEVEKRTKVKSRVMANTLAELIRDSSQGCPWERPRSSWRAAASTATGTRQKCARAAGRSSIRSWKRRIPTSSSSSSATASPGTNAIWSSRTAADSRSSPSCPPR